jgi:hypothetical protein
MASRNRPQTPISAEDPADPPKPSRRLNIAGGSETFADINSCTILNCNTLLHLILGVPWRKTGFSREGVCRHAGKSRVITRPSSRLKPVLQRDSCTHRIPAYTAYAGYAAFKPVGPALAGKAPDASPQNQGVNARCWEMGRSAQNQK